MAWREAANAATQPTRISGGKEEIQTPRQWQFMLCMLFFFAAATAAASLCWKFARLLRLASVIRTVRLSVFRSVWMVCLAAGRAGKPPRRLLAEYGSRAEPYRAS